MVNEYGRHNKQKQCRFRDTVYKITEKTISGVHVSPGSANTLAKIGGLTNYHSIAYTLSATTLLKNTKKSLDVRI